MDISQMYIALALIVLAVVAALIFLIRRDAMRNRLTPLAGLAFAFVLAGLFFGENRPVGYSLMGIGIVLAVLDMLNRSRQA